MIRSINPASGKLIKEYQHHSHQEIIAKIELAQKGFEKWSELSFEKRGEYLIRVGQKLTEQMEACANMMTQEMGKPIVQARAEVSKCAQACEYYAENAAKLLKDEMVKTDAHKSYITFDPLGVILGVMPWNFPFWQVFRFAVPTLMAGNSVIIKHASNVSGCALMIEELCAELPKGCFQVVLTEPDSISHLLSHPDIKAVSLTGSEHAGSSIGMQAGEHLKKAVLELGGSDPFIILEDADLDSCLSTCIQARLVNAGQSCIAAKRFIVMEQQYHSFCAALVEKLQKINVGDPMQEYTEMGPLARLDLLESLDIQVQESIKMGATLLYGGKRLNSEGFFYAPTLLGNVQKGMPAYEEETFGPVFAIISVKDEEEAIKVANDTSYGLGASLWTSDLKKAEKLAKKIKAGSVYVNGQVISNIQLPFGGIKNSGYGRELSAYGIKEFVNVKTVVIYTDKTTQAKG